MQFTMAGTCSSFLRPSLRINITKPPSPASMRPNSGDLGRRRRGFCKVSWPRRQQRRRRMLVVVGEIAGQYEEGFDDVHEQLVNNFTQKAVRTVLYQLYEMNPPKYIWFYNFVAANHPNDGKLFLRALAKETQELAERVMVTRLHLYGKWIKKCDHAKMYERISDENLELMRERLKETVIWPSEDNNTDTSS